MSSIRESSALNDDDDEGTAAVPPPGWVFFVAGALLPSIAYFVLPSGRGVVGTSQRRRRTAPAEHDEGNDDDDSEEEEEEVNQPTRGGPSSSWGLRHAPYKMMLLVNQELSMGKGKVAAQCCHAAVGCYKRATVQCPSALRAWEMTGCAKIAVKCPTQDEMEEIAAKAASLDIPTYLVMDAGRTQIAAGSRTVLGMFGPASAFMGVTDHLKLM